MGWLPTRPARFDLEIVEGEDYDGLVTITDADGAVVSIAGWSFDAYVRRHLDAPVVAQATCSIVGDGTGGQVRVRFTDTQTLAIADAIPRGRWDLRSTNGSSDRGYPLWGLVRIRRTVTQ